MDGWWKDSRSVGRWIDGWMNGRMNWCVLNSAWLSFSLNKINMWRRLNHPRMFPIKLLHLICFFAHHCVAFVGLFLLKALYFNSPNPVILRWVISAAWLKFIGPLLQCLRKLDNSSHASSHAILDSSILSIPKHCWRLRCRQTATLLIRALPTDKINHCVRLLHYPRPSGISWQQPTYSEVHSTLVDHFKFHFNVENDQIKFGHFRRWNETCSDQQVSKFNFMPNPNNIRTYRVRVLTCTRSDIHSIYT